MNISDTIQFLMLIASTAAIIVSAWMSRAAIKASMDMVKEQNYIQMFAEYTKRYQDIIMSMPKSVYEENAVIDDDVSRYMQLYFNLCSEEFDLKSKDAISHDVWVKWLAGVRITMQHPIYQEAWQLVKGNYNVPFRNFFDEVIKEVNTNNK